MKQTKNIMGMPITIEIIDENANQKNMDEVFNYFRYVDEKFSTYKPQSEISQINKGLLKQKDYSEDMNIVLNLSEKTKKETDGYFDIYHNNQLDPSGLVKGWAIKNAADILKKKFSNFYVEAGGDIQVYGKNSKGKNWAIGIKNPFDTKKNVKIIQLTNKGIATSGTYLRGSHIYNPLTNKNANEIASISVIGPDVYEADRFATAAFAMGEKGIYFIENLSGFEGYAIDKNGKATLTSGFEKYIIN